MKSAGGLKVMLYQSKIINQSGNSKCLLKTENRVKCVQKCAPVLFYGVILFFQNKDTQCCR